VNAKDDAFGHGYLDSYTLASGHEFAEAETDPDSFPFQDGWNDYQTSENGDKCAYFDAANLHVGSLYWAVQPLWSNEANGGFGGCAMKLGTGTFPIPGVSPLGSDTGPIPLPNGGSEDIPLPDPTPTPVPVPAVTVPAAPNPTVTLPPLPF
jgi:hypothetical protein